jgi:serine/threonine-protein kinase
MSPEATLGTYRLVGKLGEGGMGAVYVGEHVLIGRRAAIKVLLPQYSMNEEIVQRFFNEARAVTQISDSGIVQVFDFGYASDGSAYIVMELLEGESLDRRLERVGRMAPLDALRLFRLACGSLGAAHAKGVVHRDLKPENIFLVGDPAVTGGERPKLLDFGIAKLTTTDPDRAKTRTGLVIGTPVYMSPEQCRGAADVDLRADIYAMGGLLMTMLTGRPPFECESSGELIAAHLREPPPLPSQRVPGLPPELDRVVARCLAKAPDERYASAAALANAVAVVEQAVVSAMSATILPAPVGAPAGTFASPTTLSGAAGAATAPRPHALSRLGVVLVAAASLVAGGAFVIAKSRHERGETAVAAPNVPAGVPRRLAIDPAPPPPDAAPPDAPPDAAPPDAAPDAAPPNAAPPHRTHHPLQRAPTHTETPDAGPLVIDRGN